MLDVGYSFTIVSFYFCYQIDIGDVLVVVLMMKSLWVILISLRIFFFLFPRSNCGDLIFEFIFVVAYPCQFFRLFSCWFVA